MGDWYRSVKERASQRTIDEVGNRYGMLTVLAPAPSLGRGARWLCQCDCGNTITVEGGRLRQGSNRSCGCMRKLVSVIPGQRFGRLTVLRELPGQRFECKCDCGRITTVAKSSLTRGATRSCGCLRNGAHTRDLAGQRFGMLTVLRLAGNPCTSSSGSAQWLCRCDCGSEIVTLARNLVSGDTRSCGCLSKIDETGRRYGMLTVIGSAPSKGNNAMWFCKCDCGNTITVNAGNLRSGRTKSCGCFRKAKGATRMMDLTGNRYGMLTALYPAASKKGRGVMWFCKCDCGNTTMVLASKLRIGHCKSCGCLRKKEIKE